MRPVVFTVALVGGMALSSSALPALLLGAWLLYLGRSAWRV